MNTKLSTPLLALILAGAPLAQTTPPQDPRLQKAILAELSEHDPARAQQFYQEIFNDLTAPQWLRHTAGVRLVGYLQNRGRDEEARALAARIPPFEGSATDAAAPGTLRQDDPIDLEIASLIEFVRKDGAHQGPMNQLVWLGERAVPKLIAAIDAEPRMLSVTWLASVLMRIGGPRVETWLDSVASKADSLRRRAVVVGHGFAKESTRVSVARLAAFADSADPEVRVEALTAGIPGTWKTFMASLVHADARVRHEAWNRFYSPQSLLPGMPDGDAALKAEPSGILDAAARMESELDAGTIAAVLRFYDLNTGAEDTLRAYLRVTSSFEKIPNQAWSGNKTVGADALGDELIVAVRKASTDPETSMRRLMAQRLADAIAPYWTHANMPRMLELAEFGVGFEAKWFTNHATPADWGALLANIAELRLPPKSLHRLVDESCQIDLPATAFAPLRDFFVARARSTPDSDGERLIATLALRLALFDSPESLAWCETMLTGKLQTLPALGGGELSGVVRDYLVLGVMSGDTEARRMLRRRLAVVDGDDPSLERLRNHALGRIVRDHDVGATPLFAAAYQRGLVATDGLRDHWNRSEPYANAQSVRGIGWFAFDKLGEWTDSERAEVLRPCLEIGHPQAWADASRINSRPKGTSTTATARAIASQLAQCPDQQARAQWTSAVIRMLDDDPETLSAVRARALRDPDPEVVKEALSSGSWGETPWTDALRDATVALLDHENPRFVRDAISKLTSGPGHVDYERIAKLLDREDGSVAHYAAFALVRIDAARAAEDLLPRAGRQMSDSTLCEVAKQTLDRRFVPALITALRAPSDSIRESAKAALDAIEYYVSQSQRWQRLLDESGLDADSAAEALIKQSKSDDPTIRLAAIRSLGTLGKPEALPFLIQLMQSPDGSIKQAAAAAVEKINGKQ